MADPLPEGADGREAGGDAAAEAAAAGGPRIALVPPCRLVVKATAGARVIGKRGESIKAIRAASAASVKVLQDELPEALRRRKECIVLASCGEAAALRVAIAGILDRVFDRSGLPDAAERDRERPFVVDVIVPERASAPLVGPGGESVKALIEELGCEINVVREPLPGIAVQKRVRVLSRERERVDAAVWRLQEVLAEFIEAGTLKPEVFELREALPSEEERQRAAASGEEVPLRILLSKHEAATVVGRMGANVMRLRDIAHVSIDEAEAPPFDPTERVCFVAQAPLGDRLRVLRLVLADLCAGARARGESQGADEPALAEGSRPVRARILLPAERWGELEALLPGSGRDGAEPCPLLRETGAAVLAQERGRAGSGAPAALRALELQGAEEDVAVAAWRLHRLLEPWEPSEAPPRAAAPAPRAGAEPEEGAAGGRGGAGGGGGGGGDGRGAEGPGGGRAAGDRIEPERRPSAPPARVPELASGCSGAGAAEVASAARGPVPSSSSGSPAAAVSSTMGTGLPAPAAAAEAHAPMLTGSSVEGIEGTTLGLSATPTLPPSAQQSDIMPQPQHFQSPNIPSGGARPSAPTASAPERAPVSAVLEHAQDTDVGLGVRLEAAPAGDCSLLVAIPDDSSAAYLASDASGIARHACVRLKAWPAGCMGASAVLQITGKVTANSFASYLVQLQLWLSSALGSRTGSILA